MAQFWCPQCKKTTVHSEPESTQKGVASLVCHECGLVRTIENVHTMFCHACKKLTPQQIRQDVGLVLPVCLFCGKQNTFQEKGEK